MYTKAEKIKFSFINNFFLISFFFYYYLPTEFGIIIYGFLVYTLVAEFNINLRRTDFLIISLSAILFTYYILDRVAPVFDTLNVLRYCIGIVVFALYFKNKKSFDATNLLYLMIFSVFLEAILINTVLTVYDMPNFPKESIGANSHFSSTVALSAETGGGLGQTRIGFDVPIGFGGIRAVTGNLIVLLLFLSRKNFKNEIIVLITVIFLGTGTGILSFLIYLIAKKRYIYLVGLYFLPLVFLLDENPLYKVSFEYLSILFDEKNKAIAGSYVDKNLFEFFMGVGRTDGSPDFTWLLIARSMGIIFFLSIITWLASKFNSANISILAVGCILTLHYPVIFAVPGQLIIGYVISRRNKEGYFL